MRVLLVGEQADQRAEINTVLRSLTEPELVIAETGFQGVADTKTAEVMMVLFHEDEDAPLNYLQAQSVLPARPVLFALLPKRSPSLMRRALRSGADELLFLPLDGADAARALLKISEARRRNVGVTTLAANLALALHRRQNKRAALADLDLQLGSLSVLLNVEPSRTIVDLAGPDKKLDSIQLDLTLSRHPSGLALLAAPKLIEDSERVSEATVHSILDLMIQLFDFVVVDCGSYINENVVAACEAADQIFYVLDQSLESVRGAWKFMELLERLGTSAVEPKFIINRFVARHPITEERIASTLTQPIFARIMRDDRALDRVRWSGNDIWKVAPRSAFVRSIEQLAVSIAQPAPERNAGLMSRLLNVVGARA
jgi:MinD-like ATPase involved in chromosome partitioning or flagellar assembly